MDFSKLNDKYFPSGAPESKVAKDDNAIFIERRFSYMQLARMNWYNRIQRTYKLWDVFRPWLLEGENFTKAVRFPTLRDVAVAIRNEILRTPPEATIEAEYGQYPNRAQALEFRINEIKNDPYELRVKEDCINDMLFDGIGYRRVSFYDTEDKKNGRSGWFGTGSIRIDPVNVWWDENGRYIWEPKRHDMKRDCIIKYQFPYSMFISLFGNNKRFKNVDSVIPFNMPIGSDMNYNTVAQSDSLKNVTFAIVNVYEYMNHEIGFSSIIANGTTIQDPEKLPCGRIPLIAYIFEKRRDIFYPNSLAELIAPHIYLKDTNINLEIQGQKLSLMPVTVMDGEAGYNPKIHKFGPRSIWQLTVPQGRTVNDLVAPLNKAQRDSQGAYNLNRLIESELTITSGQDRNALYLSPGELATQTAAKNQSMQKSINAVVFANELEAECQLTELMVDYVKKYDIEKVTVKGKNGKYKRQNRKVRVEGYKVNQSTDSEAEFEPKQGESGLFELNAESTDVDVRVKVKSMRTKMLLQEQKVAKLLETIPVMINLINAGAVIDPSLLSLINFNGIVEQLAEGNDMDLKKTLKDEYGKSKNRIEMEHKAIMMEIPVPIPSDEDYEESERHLKEHLRFRYVYRNGRTTNTETAIWLGLSKISQKIWADHVGNTLQNIQEKLRMSLNETGDQKQNNMMQQPLPKQPVVQSKTPASPEESISNRTLLRNGNNK